MLLILIAFARRFPVSGSARERLPLIGNGFNVGFMKA